MTTSIVRSFPPRTRLIWRLGGILLLTTLGVGAGCLLVYPPWNRPPSSEADGQLQLARQALARHDPEQARALLVQYLQIRPADAEAHFLLAQACRLIEDLGAWSMHLKRAGVLGWPARNLALERLLQKVQSGDHQVFEPLLEGLRTGAVAEGEVCEAVVRGHLETHHLPAALAWIERWQRRYPDDPRPLAYRGRIQELNRDPEAAVAEYRKALELQPDLPMALVRLGATYLVLQQPDEALRCYQARLAQAPDDLTALFGVAASLCSLGRLEEAQLPLEQLLAQCPDHAGALFLRGKAELAAGNAAEALSWLKKAEAVAPAETDLTYTISQALRQLQRDWEAQQYEARHLELSGGLKQLEKLRQSILRDPDNLQLHHEAGALCLRLGRDDEASRWFQGVLRLDPDHQPTHQLLADYYRIKGDRQREEIHRQRAARK